MKKLIFLFTFLLVSIISYSQLKDTSSVFSKSLSSVLGSNPCFDKSIQLDTMYIIVDNSILDKPIKIGETVIVRIESYEFMIMKLNNRTWYYLEYITETLSNGESIEFYINQVKMENHTRTIKRISPGIKHTITDD